jgi:hypothetical protein
MADVAMPTAAPTPFPEGDPRNAKYFETLAALEHTLKDTLATDEASLAAAKASYEYNTGQLDRQLPLTMQATRNTANSQGLLESGQLAQRAGTVEAKYAAQRGRLTSLMQQTEGRITNAERAATEAFNLNRTRSASTAREEGLKGLEQEAPNAQTATPAATTASPIPPLVVGQRAQPNSGSRVAQRRQAAKKAVRGVG